MLDSMEWNYSEPFWVGPVGPQPLPLYDLSYDAEEGNVLSAQEDLARSALYSLAT